MKNLILLSLAILFLIIGCSEGATEPTYNEPPLELISPNGGERFYVEDTNNIWIESNTELKEIYIRCYIESIDEYYLIDSIYVDSITEFYQYKWKPFNVTKPESCLIRIELVEDSQKYDESDDYFILSDYQ